MKAGIIINGTGAILVSTSCGSLDDPNLVASLRGKGVSKYIAFEVPVDLVKDRYGRHFEVVMSDHKQSDVCRVLDVDGSRIFKNFSLSDFGQIISYEEPTIRRKAA